MGIRGDHVDSFADKGSPAGAQTRGTRRIRSGWAAPVPLGLLVAVVIGGGFAAYQRIGTIANVGEIGTTRNLAGGFVAVGMTSNQPGFFLVSAMDETRVRIEAKESADLLSGMHTRLRVETPIQSWSRRLRRPVVITIDGRGHIVAETVDWPRHTFATLAETADCLQDSALIKKHCGAPFLDFQARIGKWPSHAVPGHLRRFLAAHADTADSIVE